MLCFVGRHGRGWLRVACLLLAFVTVACKKDPAERRPWDGPTRLIHHRKVEPRPASQTDFKAVKLRGFKFDLTVPVNWKQGPSSSKTVRDQFHQWKWIWPLLRAYETSKDKKSLEKALEIAFDWIHQNPIEASESGTQAWRRSNAAWRAEAIGYLFRTGVEAGLLDEDQEELLLKTAREHAVWLLSDEHYAHDDNDGLLQDYGLVVLCAQLNKIADCKTWKNIAVKRFIKNLRGKTSKRAVLYLGQSPSEHFSAIQRAAQMAELVKNPDLDKIEKDMKEAAGWLVPPDGNQLMLGTTRSRPVPDWAKKQANALSGMSPFDDSGWSVVKDKQSYLIATAAYHPNSFKQADDLTFSWSELGKRIISDTGFYSYSSRSSQGRYANSSSAHNTLTVDGQNFKPGKPYGSAIKAVGEDSGWYAVMANNPSISVQQVAHERLWLYKPGEWLVVVDKVGSPRPRTYNRYFHFWYQLDANLSDDGQVSVDLQKTPLHVRDFSTTKVEAKLVRKQHKPIQGVMYVSSRKAKPNDVLQLTSQGDRAVYAVAFRLGKELPEKLSASYDDKQFYRIELGDQVFTLGRDKRKIRFTPPTSDASGDKGDAGDKKPAGGASKNEKQPADAKKGAAKALSPAKVQAPKPAAPKPVAPKPPPAP